MLRFRELGIRKFAEPREKFDWLLATEWKERFSWLFGSSDKKMVDSFRAAHEKFLNAKPASMPLHELPAEHVKKHIEFTARSFAYGWKTDKDTASYVEEEYAHLVETSKRPQQPPESNLNAMMLYSCECVLRFLESRRADSTEHERISFFEQLVAAKILEDPLFLSFMLDRTPESGLAGFSRDLIRRHESADCREPIAGSQHSGYDAELAQRFKLVEIPFDLGSRFGIYSVDGQIGSRIRKSPEELAESTAKSLASILVYGIVPGGVVGGEINHHQIHLGVDRADIDLLTVYPDLQAVIIVPLADVINDSPYNLHRGNAKVWYNGDRKRATELMLGIKDGWLPHIEPSKLAIVLPFGLENLFRKAVDCLTERLGIKKLDLRNIIPYDPANWENVHTFVEFLQSEQDTASRIQYALGKDKPISPLDRPL
jgi:hypothetical protein